ncbi:MAG: hypothetical protein IPM97_12320 [Bdellovibrionaceae bacterium]|nr:hypothetical protein [Pseudobdellovibrionaceae bacterium]
MVSLLRLVRWGIVVGFCVFSQTVPAEEVVAGSVYDQAKESEILQKARRRAYAGGRDEGDLTVQPQLVAPIRKMAPQTESELEPGGDESF